jgi:lysyl-tRNA synthetase class 2
VGGLERVYEISKDFRNEGLSRFHNPEFTMLEAYQAYGDYTDMMRLTEKLVAAAAAAVNGGTTVEFAGVQADVAPPWPRKSYCGLIEAHTGHDVRGADNTKLAEVCKTLKLPLEKHMDEGALLDLIFSEKVEPHLVGPIFVTEFPVSTTPLAKRSPDDPAYVDRFEAFIFGKELVNAFTELNDPVDQHQRFEEQMGLKAGGDEEAQMMDEDYVRALEHGMPPAGGLGLGVDRLTMFLTGAENIREVILFPKLKPLQAGADTSEPDGDSDEESAPEPSPAAEA